MYIDPFIGGMIAGLALCIVFLVITTIIVGWSKKKEVK